MSVDSKATSLQGITDLTVLADIMEGFVLGAFETETLVERLRRVLAVLDAIRKETRESALDRNPFPDSVGVFQAIHFFRFSIVPPPATGKNAGAPYRLLLNVTFDGGWETYMRTIWGPLGTLLDLMFCHCEGYPIAFDASFDDYMRWVREHEVPGNFFYADSATSIADTRYAEAICRLQRERGHLPDADLRAARYSVPARPDEVALSAAAVAKGGRALKALAGLRPLFPKRDEPRCDDDIYLWRFTTDLLSDLHGWCTTREGDPVLEAVAAAFKEERRWLVSRERKPRPVLPAPAAFRLSAVQAGIAGPFPAVQRTVHGALVLLAVDDPARARAWLAGTAFSGGDSAEIDAVCTVALTFTGLAALGVAPETLARLPKEFRDGMEARAGVLGDVRGNHPQHWKRPRPNWLAGAGAPGSRPGAPAIELSSAHVLVQLRTAARPGDEESAAARPEDGGDGGPLLVRLAAEVDALGERTGLRVLFVQAMRQEPNHAADPFKTNHFGFFDGISQPALADAANALERDRVPTGDLFLGYPNSRGDGAGTHDGFLGNGSFLVVRKLRQHLDRLDAVLKPFEGDDASLTDEERKQRKEVVRAKMMGRTSLGAPLFPGGRPEDNDFDFTNDPVGAACPFASHVRRSNPREQRFGVQTPRIARRGMSYGRLPREGEAERPYGIVFMAYNASIAEQFEVVQRWLAGGNSSGVSTADTDPFLGVPEAGVKRVFRYADGDLGDDDTGVATPVVRVDLGDQPLVELEWGVYAFVPSLAALRSLAPAERGAATRTVAGAPGVPPDAAPDPAAEIEAWRLRLEDGTRRAAAWAEVRAKGGVLDTEYGLLVGGAAQVLEVLKDDGSVHSVCGYGKRMRESLGLGYLGEDHGPTQRARGTGHAAAYVERVNEAIETAVTEEAAYEAARNAAEAWLEARLGPPPASEGAAVEVAIDVPSFAGAVIAGLCAAWFGLPDGRHMLPGPRSDDPQAKASCPGHFLTTSRYVFQPRPTAQVESLAKAQGKVLLEAMRAFVAEPGLAAHDAPLSHAILAAMDGETPDLQARTLVGVMLGFPPTTIGNFATIGALWATTRRLWDLQQRLYAEPGMPAPVPHEAANRLLRAVLLQTMAASPVPYMDWRTAGDEGGSIGGVPFKPLKLIVLGLGSAVQDPGAASLGGETHKLMFGGARAGPLKATHACPGYGLAMGTMLGCFAALLTAGTLRPTANPTVLTLSRNA